MKLFKRFWKLLLLVAVMAFAMVALGDTGPSPLPGAGAPPTSLGMWLALLAPVAVAVLDFLFAINSKAKSNGFLHWLYLLAGGKETPPQGSA